MITILLHSSKTMRPAERLSASYQAPVLLKQAVELADYLQTIPAKDLQSAMQISPTMAEKTHSLIASWTANPDMQRPAIDTFLGDIYSGLQVQSFSPTDRAYANKHLFILSGLYGVVRALDSIHPYRLEMGYRLPDEPYKNLYKFWGDAIASKLPTSTIINLSAVEYTKAVLPYLPNIPVITPKFLTVSPKTGEPTFVTVHAKIARGAFARWLIQNKIETSFEILRFQDIGYSYDASLSTPEQPVFVCKDFEGIGLSVRLT